MLSLKNLFNKDLIFSGKTKIGGKSINIEVGFSDSKTLPGLAKENILKMLNLSINEFKEEFNRYL